MVGTKQPNELGLYDMTGNVIEYCADWYDEDYYMNSPGKNPGGPLSGTTRVLRGGSWFNLEGCRVSGRYGLTPTSANILDGFRCAHDAK